MNRPLSEHWADIAAFKLLRRRSSSGKEGPITVSSGITPSGTVHMGNFREVFTAHLVARALRSLGKEVRFLYSWDNFDAFRKVPKNFPAHSPWQRYLGCRLSQVPDPWQQSTSLAQGRITLFEQELIQMGINPQFRYQEQRYNSGCYSQGIQQALQKRHLIRNILNTHRTQPLEDSWWPLVCYCPNCGKNTTDLSYDEQWHITSNCRSCGSQSEHDLRLSPHIKLTWRVDWPMRWAHEGVDLEPGGKDHSSKGGSYETACSIAEQVFGYSPPDYLAYDFVKLKGQNAKMSSSEGNILTLSEATDIYEPQIIRWIFARNRPNHEFSLSLEEDVLKIYEEFDHDEKIALMPPPTSGKLMKKYPLIRRTYELSCLTEQPSAWIERPAFRMLCDRLQICSLDIPRTLERFYPSYRTDKQRRLIFEKRARAAAHWLTSTAPSEYTYQLRTKPPESGSSSEQRLILNALLNLSNACAFESKSAEQLHHLLYEQVIHPSGREPQRVFTVIYQALIQRSQGPRLAGFLVELGSKRVAELIELALRS